jgi:hypothetical protein
MLAASTKLNRIHRINRMRGMDRTMLSDILSIPVILSIL